MGLKNQSFIVADSGERESFSTGAVRDTSGNKPRPDLISPFVLERIGSHMRRGADKYSAWNWAKGMPSSRFYESLMRHLMKYAQGERDEDHLSAAAFNLFGLIHNEELCGSRIEIETEPGEFHTLSADLLDFPVFHQRENNGEVTDQSVVSPQKSDGSTYGA